MEKGYKNLVYFFLVIAVITFIGFYKKYFSLAPDFPGLKNIHHFHALALSTWLSMLIIQPILIANNKMTAHKLIGKFSYLLVPFMFVSMILAYHNQYLRFVAEGKPETASLAFVFSPTTDAIPFVIFYLLAILNKRETAKHMRYMICTGIVIGGPGLGRIFMTWMDMDIFAAIGLMTLFTLLVFIGFIVYDRVKNKHFRINPFTIAFIIWLIPNILIIFFPNTAFWQGIAKWMVATF
ncbi:hypothetical protein [Flavihumibacter fluvii]|uniref:hypothetical protein n=1 Tax=Flavihumibacter fluvii TaxID=2838157 RepID=UPI001BDEE26E|nr:hypothetical protein [Flavihumibacter fluvii]ULQ53390.1 hypothetical protein KJS93_03540 [Flavihumibacter fluvii]